MSDDSKKPNIYDKYQAQGEATIQFVPPPQEHILQFFSYEHLPPFLQAISRPFCELAYAIVYGDNDPRAGTVTMGGPQPRTPERTVALRKLLEAKDAAVRNATAVGLLLLALLGVAGSASAQPSTQTIPYPPSVDYSFIWWSHPKTNLHHFEMKLDANQYTEVIPNETEPREGLSRFRYSFPALTPGQHTIFIRACGPPTQPGIACSDGGQLVAVLTVTVPMPTEIQVGGAIDPKPKPPEDEAGAVEVEEAPGA